MRLVYIVFLCLALGAGVLWTWANYAHVKTVAKEYLVRGNFQTLEVRHSAQSIMENHKTELLKDAQHEFLEPTLKFYPYLLMEVKYNRSAEKTNEGIILWSLVDGEMVLNTRTWDRSHGFTDCLRAGADREDFKLINTLALHGGSLDLEALTKYLNMDNQTLDHLLEKSKRKSLIVQCGNIIRLHLQNPKMHLLPETQLDQYLVTQKGKEAQRIRKKFNSYQIEHIAKSAFGNDFAIRKTKEIFLPVYSISIQNPDGSQRTTYWNALNGKKLPQECNIE